MFFTPESIIKKRHELIEQMEAGTLTRAQTFLRALELDPFDALALTVLADERFRVGDLAAAAEYAWRAAEADPYRDQPWHLLHKCLTNESEALLNGILELALSKSMRDPETFENLKEQIKSRTELEDIGPGEAMESLLQETSRKRRYEPAEVSARLRPHRLVDEVLDAGAGLDKELVDSIVEDGGRCTPLLVGVLRASGSGSLPEEEDAPVVASLALLGEIGDPARLPEVIECASVDEEGISDAAQWAAFRIVSRRPDESLLVLRQMTPGAPADERSAIANTLSRMRDLPGLVEALEGLLDDLGSVPKEERFALFINVASALMISAGARGREVAWSLFHRYQGLLPKRTRGELQESTEASKELAATGHDFQQDFQSATVYDFCSGAFDDEEDDEEDEEDDDDLPPEPVRRRIAPGRNDPCWCGSGKKYKKCHLEADEAAALEETPVPGPALVSGGDDTEERLRRRLIDFSTKALGNHGMQKAMEAFIGEQPPEGSDQQSLAMEAVDWVIHDYVPPRLGHTIIEEFRKRNPGSLSAREREMLDAWSRARFSLFEVREVQSNAGVALTDLLAGGEFFVQDVSTAKRAARWDTYLARVEELDGLHHFTAVLMTVPRELLPDLKEWAVHTQQRSGLPWDQFLHSHSHKFRQEASRLIGGSTGPQRMVSAEGDDLVFSKAHYQILNEDALRAALNQSPSLIQNDDGSYGWVDEKENEAGGRRAFGHLEIAHGELILECQTRRRLERGKKLLHDLAGAALRHKADDFRGWKAALKDYEASGVKPKESGVPPEVEREIVGKMMAEHYRTWPDQPLPYLGGLTPRVAVATPEGRAQVIELLKMFENGEERNRREGHATYDFSKLKAELGVDY